VEETAPPQLAQPSPSAYPRPRDDGSRAKEESFLTGTPTPGKPTITYLLRCIVRIGDSVTVHIHDALLNAHDTVMFEITSRAFYTNPNHRN
jgi:hypothetical protein